MVLALETDKHWGIGSVLGVSNQFNIGHLNLIQRAKERCDNHLNDSEWTWEEELLEKLRAEPVFFPYTKEVDD